MEVRDALADKVTGEVGSDRAHAAEGDAQLRQSVEQFGAAIDRLVMEFAGHESPVHSYDAAFFFAFAEDADQATEVEIVVTA